MRPAIYIQQKAIRAALLAAILLYTTPERSEQAAGQHKNQHHLHSMCKLVALTKVKTITGDTSKIGDEEVDDIMKINISLANPSWSSKLATKPTEKKHGTPHCTDPTNKPECTAEWAKWEDLSIEIHESDTSIKEFIPAGNRRLSPAGRAAAVFIQGLLAKAARIKDDYNSNRKEEDSTPPPKALSLIQEAVYGAKIAPPFTEAKCKITLTSTRANDCKGAPGLHAACGALICLCANQGTQNEALCGDTASATHAAGWNAGQQDALWSKIATVCNAYPAPVLTPQLIRATLQEVTGRIGTKNTGEADNLVLGIAHNDGGCSTQAGVGCIQLDKVNTKDGTAPTGKLLWADKLAEAADHLEKTEHEIQKRIKAIQDIKQIKAEAEQLLKAVIKSEDESSQLPPKQNPTGHETILADKKECKGRKENKTQCEKAAKCEWKGESETKGECKPKDEEKQPNTAGAGGASGEKDKCGEAKTPEDCAKVTGTTPEGKNSVCGWIDDKCQNSTFLLNKHFALTVVSAAFVALLF